jgi:hypothetical protein
LTSEERASHAAQGLALFIAGFAKNPPERAVAISATGFGFQQGKLRIADQLIRIETPPVAAESNSNR